MFKIATEKVNTQLKTKKKDINEYGFKLLKPNERKKGFSRIFDTEY
jgi:hypothetical protein